MKDSNPTMQDSNTTEDTTADIPRNNTALAGFPRTGLTRQQRIGIWGGVIGSVVGCTAWLLAFAGLAGDWLAFTLTILVDVAAVMIFGKLCVQRGSKRFLWIALMIVLLSAHCLAVFWWRFEGWRGGTDIPYETLMRERRVVTYTVAAAVALLGVQFGLMHWLLSRSHRRRTR